MDAREDKVLKHGPSNGFIAADTKSVIKMQSNTQWFNASAWEPYNNSEFALDPDGRLYAAACSASVMEEALPSSTSGDGEKKKKRSNLSVSHQYWLMSYIC